MVVKDEVWEKHYEDKRRDTHKKARGHSNYTYLNDEGNIRGATDGGCYYTLVFSPRPILEACLTFSHAYVWEKKGASDFLQAILDSPQFGKVFRNRTVRGAMNTHGFRLNTNVNTNVFCAACVTLRSIFENPTHLADWLFWNEYTKDKNVALLLSLTVSRRMSGKTCSHSSVMNMNYCIEKWFKNCPANTTKPMNVNTKKEHSSGSNLFRGPFSIEVLLTRLKDNKKECSTNLDVFGQEIKTLKEDVIQEKARYIVAEVERIKNACVR